MKHNKFILIFFLICSVNLYSQNDNLSLKELYKFAYENYPNSKQIKYFNDINDLKLKNLNVNFLPQISLKGQATYQSEVTKLNISNPLFKPEELNKDQYKLTLDVKQLIFDGGTVSSQKESELSQLKVDKQKLEVELFGLRSRVNDLFFSILLLQEKKKVNENLIKDLNQRISEMESKVRNEIITPNNVYILQAQVLQTEQEIESIDADRKASLKMLSELVGKNLSENSNLDIPFINEYQVNNDFSSRPEYKLFDYQKNQLKSYSDIVNTRIIPKFSAFGQAGFGRPGLNMLDNSFQPFYMVGLSLSWNPINWNSNDNELQIYKINENIIDLQKETFEKNLKVSLEKYKSEIDKYENLLKKDDDIISLRNKIIATLYSQLQNGTITSTVYLTELNNKSQSQIMLETHKIQLLQAKINYLTAKGVY